MSEDGGSTGSSGGGMFQWLLDGIQAAYDALIAWLLLIFESLKSALFDFPVLIFDKLLGLASWLFMQFDSSLECCISGVSNVADSLQSRLDAVFSAGQAGQAVCFLLDQAGFQTALACITAGVMFRFTRKILFLGLW